MHQRVLADVLDEFISVQYQGDWDALWAAAASGKVDRQSFLVRAFKIEHDVSLDTRKVLEQYLKLTPAEIEQAPIVKLVDTMLSGAVDHKASDIHVEPKEDHAIVRYRVDGMLHKILTIPRHAVAARYRFFSYGDCCLIHRTSAEE